MVLAGNKAKDLLSVKHTTKTTHHHHHYHHIKCLNSLGQYLLFLGFGGLFAAKLISKQSTMFGKTKHFSMKTSLLSICCQCCGG